MNTKTNVLILRMIAAAALIFIISSCGGDEKEEAPVQVIRPVKTITLSGGQGTGRSFPGKVQGSQRVNLSFRVRGPLIEFPVNEGDEVKKGQLLARLDPRDYQIAYDEAYAQFVEAQADYKRYKDLYERNAVPLADLDVRRAKRDTAKAKLDYAKANIDYTYLRAPFSGYVGAKFVENYQEVNSFDQILSLQDLSKVEIVIDLPENILASTKAGDVVGLYATFQSAPGEKFPLAIKEVSAQADPRTQTYRATLIMDQPGIIRVLPGMTAQVHYEGKANTNSNGNYFVIPAIAVVTGDGPDQYVWIVDQNDLTVRKRKVRVGAVTGQKDIEILGGLKAGEMIAVTGIGQLQEGMQVTLLN
ncbi:MAG TPA: efflux RND transporter periplasmic adaptor subunit [Thermodesulfobacteriota bacterium]|nr:efflux RND transporter periplasmic adaptor subunit [Thermodesulfobacteriota bacterium]